MTRKFVSLIAIVGVLIGWSTAQAQTCPCSLWDSGATPAIAGDDPGAVELGVKFLSDVDGFVSGIRFYKTAGNTGTHSGSLWTSSGTRLATATFTNETASGWQQVNFSTPVAIQANTVYVASYFAPNGHYALNEPYFDTGVTRGVLYAPADGEFGANGVYRYGSTSGFPTSTYLSSNYWVDIVFTTTGSGGGSGSDTTPPTLSITSPTSAATYTTTSSTVSLGGSSADNVGVTQISWTNDRGGSGTGTGTAAWTISNIALQSGANVVTVTARDAAGNTVTKQLTVTYNAPTDTTAPTVASRTPAPGATGVVLSPNIVVTFSEAMSAASISTTSIELRNAANNAVAATVSYNSSSFTATLTPSSALASGATYTVLVRGGTTDPRVKDAAGNALAADVSWTFTTVNTSSQCALNAITTENCLTGNPRSEWDVSGAGDTSIQGFATQISVNRGGTVQFKVKTPATGYRIDIYRLGYYGGSGARKVATIQPSVTLPQTQPSCLTQASSGLIDCGNWKVSASWTIPANATSGLYIARPRRNDTGGASHIPFIVRDDASMSDVVFQTSDTTWQAYNNYGGNSLYQGGPGTNPARAYKVSYNRPFNTRAIDGGPDWIFNADFPMIRWLEANGYDLTYITGVDSDRAGSLIRNHKVFLSVGHDEYWSAQQRTNVEAARNAGINLAFFSANEIFWKTRWENSIDGSGTTYRTLVSYKETHANAKIDPTTTWTGSWADPRFSPPADGGRPQNALSGTMFGVNGPSFGSIEVPATYAKMRLWRNTSVAQLTPGDKAVMPYGTLGYEWDWDADNGSRPAGLIRLSSTTLSNAPVLLDYGSTFGNGTATHNLTMYRHSSGALVFGAGTIHWSWGLDNSHLDIGAGSSVDVRMQQATVNILADMSAQPSTLQAGLVAATKSTDAVAPSTTITSPANGASVRVNTSTTITGTAADSGGGVVAGVEVSTDGGTTWHPANGRESWTYNWTPTSAGAVTVRARAVDDSGNLASTSTSVAVTVSSTATFTCPCSLWNTSIVPDLDGNDPAAVELGLRFRSSVSGFITAIRFYKASGNTGSHVVNLWSSTGQNLARKTATGETASGWQTVTLTSPVAISANTTYVVSYFAPVGRYSGNMNYFGTAGSGNGPLYAFKDGEGGSNGLYRYGSSTLFPTLSDASTNYWVDVVFTQ